MKILLAALFGLTACATTVSTTPVTQPVPLVNLENYTQGDLETAKTLGNAAGDANGASCWTYLSKLIPAIMPPAEIGVATGIEVARLGQVPEFEARCAAVGMLSGLPAAFNLPKIKP